jgi:phycoerythrin-associated linker protein
MCSLCPIVIAPILALSDRFFLQSFMDIQEFINVCAGKWFSQRTSYQLAAQKVANNKAEITIDLLAADVVKLCLENNCQSQSSLGGWKAT